MKILCRYFQIVLLGICIVNVVGCSSKKNSASETDNKVRAIVDIMEVNAVISEAENEMSEKKEKPQVEQKEENSNTKPSATVPNKNISSKKPYFIKVNRLANCVTIYKLDENGAYTIPIKAMVCSVGKNINKTPVGVFKISDRYAWRYLYGDQYGQYATRIMGHILFHSVPYTSQSKNTLKTYYYNNLGIGDSMGCIRLTCADAKWIYDNCAKGTTVEIYESTNPGPLGKPTAMKIDEMSPYAGWDPTDPDASNPWKTAKPTILGVTNLTVVKGGEVDYLSNVSAIDAYGVTLQVNTIGEVDVNTCGEYVITYSATDARGNIESATAVITVIMEEKSDKSGENNDKQ